MIPVHMEPKGLDPDTPPINDVASQNHRAVAAEIGSNALLEALCRAQGRPTPRRPEPEPRIRDVILVRPDKLREPCTPVLNIQRAVSAYFEISLLHMTSAQRGRSVAHPRQIAMYLASELTPQSLVEIGRRFGGRDHTTVLHAIRTVKRRMAEDPQVAIDVRALREALEG